jgi:LPS export ABC transporter protein LptC
VSDVVSRAARARLRRVGGFQRAMALLLAVVTCATLSACEHKKQPPVAARNPLADSADQVMFGLSTYLTDNGLLKAQLQSDSAFFFDDNSRIELRKVHMTFYTNTGQKTSTLTSREGTYNRRQSTATARGDVRVVSEDGRTLTTEHLKFNQTTNEISSDSAFVLDEPTRHLEGIGFVSDPNLNNVKVLKVKQGAGTFTLPGQ